MMRLFFNIIYLFILFSCRKERCVGMLSICNLLFKDFLSQTYSDQTDRMVPPYSGKYAAQAANHSPSTQPITTQHAANHTIVYMVIFMDDLKGCTMSKIDRNVNISSDLKLLTINGMHYF